MIDQKNAEMYVKVSWYFLFCLGIVPALFALVRIHIYGGFDIAWFGQCIYNVAFYHHPFVTLESDYNHLAQHFEPILYPLGWVYRLVHNYVAPYVLLMLSQSALQAACVIRARKLFLESKDQVFQRHILIFTFSYLGFWGVVSAQTFEFHPVTLGMSFAFLAVLEHSKRSNKAGLYWILSSLCGEMFLVLMPVGLGLTFLLNSHFRLRHKLLTQLLCFIFGCGLLYVYLSLMAPLLRDDNMQSSLLGRYAHLGTTHREILYNLFLKPKLVFQTIFSLEKVFFIAKVGIFLIPMLLFFVQMKIWIKRKVQNNQFKPSDDSILFLFAGMIALSVPMAKILLSQSETYLITKHHYLADVTPALCLILVGTVNSVPNEPKGEFVISSQRVIFHFIAKAMIVCLCVAVNFRISEFTPVESGRSFKNDFKLRFPSGSFEKLKTIDRSFSIYSDTFGMSHLLSSRRSYYTEFTNPSVYSKSGYPDLLVLVFPYPKIAAGGYALQHKLETRGTSFLFIKDTQVSYELSGRHSGQTTYGISFYRKRN